MRRLEAPLKKGRRLAAEVERRRSRVERLTKLVEACLRPLLLPKRWGVTEGPRPSKETAAELHRLWLAKREETDVVVYTDGLQ